MESKVLSDGLELKYFEQKHQQSRLLKELSISLEYNVFNYY